MSNVEPTMAQQVAKAVFALQQERTGHAPQEVTVTLNKDTLVITLHGALTPAEQAVAANPAGAEIVQDFHRKLFVNSFEGLREEIKRITGVEVRQATEEITHKSGAVVHSFTQGTMVQIFLLAKKLTREQWSGKKEDINL